MFGKLFRKKPAEEQNIIVAHLAARMQPFQRAEYFEDPLDAALRKQALGEVTGGGTTMAADPVGISSCDIELTANDTSEATIAEIIRLIERLGAPKGSRLHVPGQVTPIPFGQMEGMAIFLNGTELSRETYAQADVNKTIDGLSNVLGARGALFGHWEGSSETALYFYGKSYDAMTGAVADFLKSDPLCDKCRLEQIA
jgi:hypothetical protein